MTDEQKRETNPPPPLTRTERRLSALEIRTALLEGQVAELMRELQEGMRVPK